MWCLIACCCFLIVCGLLVFLPCLWVFVWFGSLVVDLFVVGFVSSLVVVRLFSLVGVSCIDISLWVCFRERVFSACRRLTSLICFCDFGWFVGVAGFVVICDLRLVCGLIV